MCTTVYFSQKNGTNYTYVIKWDRINITILEFSLNNIRQAERDFSNKEKENASWSFTNQERRYAYKLPILT